MIRTEDVQSQRDKLFKLAVIGSGGAGKSTLIARLVTGEYIEKNMTVGFDVETWSLQNNDSSQIKLSLFDFGGQEQFRFFQESLMKGSKAALVVFDSCSLNSVGQIYKWLDMIEEIPRNNRLLVGTKIDVNDGLEEAEIQKYANEFGMDYVMVSSKTGENFEQLVQKIEEILPS